MIEKYETLIFDCDGVVLNSNKIKSQAFVDATKHLGYEYAQALLDYHVKNGGVSRYEKFKYFITKILHQEFDMALRDDLLQRFAQEVKKGLMTCDVAKGLDKLREKTAHSKWLIVSGGDQAELREVFALRGLIKYFDGGVYGSPDDKGTILKNERENANIVGKSLFLGDSKYDFQAASAANLDFIFISGWSEVTGWQDWTRFNGIASFENLDSIC